MSATPQQQRVKVTVHARFKPTVRDQDLRLVRAILRRAAAAADTAYALGPLSALDLPGAERAASIASLGMVPDLAVLSVRPGEIGACMEALAALGCHAAVVPGAAPDLARDITAGTVAAAARLAEVALA